MGMQTVLLTDGVTKRVKDIYINLAKNERSTKR